MPHPLDHPSPAGMLGGTGEPVPPDGVAAGVEAAERLLEAVV